MSLCKVLTRQFIERQFIERQFIERQFIERQFIERQFVERQIFERQFIEPTVYRTDSLSNRQFNELTVHRNESFLNFLKLNTNILNAHMQCVHRILLYPPKAFQMHPCKKFIEFY